MNVFICPSFFSPDPPVPSCLTFTDRADASLTKRGQRSSTWCWIPDRQRSWLQSGTGMTIWLRDLYLSAKNVLKVCPGIHRLNGLRRGFDSFFCRLLKSCGFAMFRPHFFVHLIVPDFTATLCDPFEGQNFKTSLSLRVEVRVHFECHGGYGICHWDWDPAWRKWISYSKNWFGRICSPCFLLFTTILFLISTFILMEYIGICYSNYEYITFLRCSPVKQSLLNSRWLPVGITGGVATGEQTRDGRGAGGVTGWTPGSIGINQCFLGDLLHRFGKNVIYCGLMGEVEDLWGNVENIGGKRHRNYIISLEIW